MCPSPQIVPAKFEVYFHVGIGNGEWGTLDKAGQLQLTRFVVRGKIEMGQILEDGDVVFVRCPVGNYESRTYQVYELLETVKKWAAQANGGAFIYRCLHDGVSAGCLQEKGDGWKEGKISLRLEFIPDEPEPEPEPEPEELEATIESTPALPAASPLDDLRAELNIK